MAHRPVPTTFYDNGVTNIRDVSLLDGNFNYLSARTPSVWEYMTDAQVADVQARTFLVDVSAALAAAFAAGVGYLPPGGYYCASSVTVTGANGLSIFGTSSTDVEVRFAAGVNGLSVSFTNPIDPPSVRGLTITTLQPGPSVSGTGLTITMTPLVTTNWRVGPLISDIIIQGQTTTTMGWGTCIQLTGVWYPILKNFSLKGYSAAGAGLNTYQTTYGIHVTNIMVPIISDFTMYHVNTGIYDDGATNGCEGVLISAFEMVGVNTGINLGNGVASPIPGTYIGHGHINASTFGVKMGNRVQIDLTDLLLYRTTATTAAWIGIQAAECHNSFFHDIEFINESADATGGNGLFITGASSFNVISHLSSDNWPGAGTLVILANTSNNNIVDANTLNPDTTGTQWFKIANLGTGINYYPGLGQYISLPNAQTGATYTVLDSDRTVIYNHAGTVTVTLPTTAPSNASRILRFVTITNNTVVSSASNVVPLAGGAAGTAILAATAGKWADLEWNGTNWTITASN